MADKLTQGMLPFDEMKPVEISPAIPDRAPARYEPRAEARAAFARLEEYLRDGLGRPVNDVAEEALRFLARSLLEGKNGYIHAGEERLEALQACPELVGVSAAEEGKFREALDDALDCLHGRMLVRENGRTG